MKCALKLLVGFALIVPGAIIAILGILVAALVGMPLYFVLSGCFNFHTDPVEWWVDFIEASFLWWKFV